MRWTGDGPVQNLLEHEITLDGADDFHLTIVSPITRENDISVPYLSCAVAIASQCAIAADVQPVVVQCIHLV